MLIVFWPTIDGGEKSDLFGDKDSKGVGSSGGYYKIFTWVLNFLSIINTLFGKFVENEGETNVKTKFSEVLVTYLLIWKRLIVFL